MSRSAGSWPVEGSKSCSVEVLTLTVRKTSREPDPVFRTVSVRLIMARHDHGCGAIWRKTCTDLERGAASPLEVPK